MAEEVKETMEQFETQLEESLNKAATNEDAVWNHLEELKESGEVLALTVGGVVMVELLFHCFFYFFCHNNLPPLYFLKHLFHIIT